MEEKRSAERSPLSGIQQELVLTFELIPEGDTSDPALIATLGHETVAGLQQDAYTVKPPVYTGQKGLDSFLVELVLLVQQIATCVESNHAAIAEGIADISGLVTVFGGLIPVLKRLREAHKKQVGDTECMTRPIKMTTEIDGAPLVIEAADLDQADAALKLALKYRSAHPGKAAGVSARSKVRVQGQVPARTKRRRK